MSANYDCPWKTSDIKSTVIALSLTCFVVFSAEARVVVTSGSHLYSFAADSYQCVVAGFTLL